MVQNKKFTLRKSAAYGLVGCVLFSGALLLATTSPTPVHAEMIRSTQSDEQVKNYQAFSVDESKLQSKRVRQHLEMTTPDGKTHDIIHDQVISRVKTGIEDYPYAYMHNMYLPTNFNAVGDIVMDTADYKANVDGILPETVSWQSKDSNYKVTYHKEATKSRFKDFKIVVRRYHFVFPDKEEFVTSRVKHFLTTLDGKDEDYDGKYATIPNANTLEFNAIPGYRVVEDATVKFDNQTKKYKATGPEITNADTEDKDIYIHLEKVDDKDVKYSFKPSETGKFSRTVHLINRSDESNVKKVIDSVKYLRFDVKRTYQDESGMKEQGLGESDFSFALERDQQRLPMHKLPVSLKDYYAEVMLTKTGDQPTKVTQLGKTFKPAYGYTEDATYINSQSLIGNSYGLSHQFIEEHMTLSNGNDKYGQANVAESEKHSDNKQDNKNVSKDVQITLRNLEDNSVSKMTVTDITHEQKLTDSKQFLAKYPTDKFEIVNVVSSVTNDGQQVMHVDYKPIVPTYKASVLVVDESTKDKTQTQLSIDGIKEKDKVIESDVFKKAFPSDKYEIIDAKQTVIDGKFYAEIRVKHQLVEKDGEPKKITRTIVMHHPVTNEMTKHSDTVEFTTKVMVDAVTGEKTDQVKYLQDELSFKDFTLPTYEGYAPNVNTIEYTKAKPTDDAETTIDIHWSKVTSDDKQNDNKTDNKTDDKNQNTNVAVMKPTEDNQSKNQTASNGTAETKTTTTNNAASSQQTQTKDTSKQQAQERLPQAGSQNTKYVGLLGGVLTMVASVGLAIRKKLNI